MIIVRYLCKEVLQVTAALTFILLVVAVLGRLLKYLAQASQGELDPSVLLLLMTYRMPEFLQLILPLALMLGIMLAYGRMYADNEMTVLHACGLSKRRLLGITFISAAIVSLAVGGLSLKVTPWGLINTDTLLEAQKDLNEFDILVPGIFQNISRGARTTYTERIEDDRIYNVFMYEAEGNRVTVASSALPSEDEQGKRIIQLLDGMIIEGATGQAAYALTRFSEMGIRLPEREISFEINADEESMPTSALLGSADNAQQAELQWRISLILIIPVLTLLAVPLSVVSPRKGRFAKLVPAMLIYISYFGLLLVCRDMVDDGKLPALVGLWWVHVIFFIAGLLVFSGWRIRLAHKQQGRVNA